MNGGLIARLRAPLEQRADFVDVLSNTWQSAPAADFAKQPVYVEGAGRVELGELFEVSGSGDATVRFVGDLRLADRLGAGLQGGEVVVDGNAGRDVGMRMRRGLIAVLGDVDARAGLSVIAGSVVVFGATGSEPGLWSKRGSAVALGTVTPPPTYRFACRYQPEHLRLVLTRLRRRFGAPVEAKHIDGFYDRFSGDLAELGKGEILAWKAE